MVELFVPPEGVKIYTVSKILSTPVITIMTDILTGSQSMGIYKNQIFLNPVAPSNAPASIIESGTEERPARQIIM